MSIYVCVNSQSGNLRVRKASEKTKSNLFLISIATQCRVRIEYVEESTCQQVAFYRRKNWQPLTICNIAQAGILCVSNKYLTALCQSFSSLSIPDVVTINIDFKSGNISLKCSQKIYQSLRIEISRH
jgi:hypothetical protein